MTLVPVRVPATKDTPERTVYAKVDDEFAEWALSRRWHLFQGIARSYFPHPTRIRTRAGKSRDHVPMQFAMHRWIMGCRPGDAGRIEVRHVNGDKLDNRQANLRLFDRAAESARRRRTRSSAEWMRPWTPSVVVRPEKIA